jgi:hypothetical protein
MRIRGAADAFAKGTVTILPLIETLHPITTTKTWLTRRNPPNSKLTGLQLSPAKGQGDSSAVEGATNKLRIITRFRADTG